MKLKIKDEEITLNWGLGAFSHVKDDLGLEIDEVITKFSEHKVNIALCYSALLNGYQVEKDDDFIKLPFSKAYFANWLEQQDKEVGEEIVKDFLQWSINGKSWADKLGIDIAKITEDAEPKEEKKRRTKKQ